MSREIRRIAVFCGSNAGDAATFAEAAAALGAELGRRGIELIYGGTHMGLMGAVANGALAAGGRVTGIITERLHGRGHLHTGLQEHKIVADMHARKAHMLERADACIALPGGIGTIEEFMEVWTLNQLGDVDKPAALLDVDNYFGHFLSFIDTMVHRSFLPVEHRDKLIVDTDPSSLIERLRTYTPPTAPKWIPR